jgi:hypothetical protein
MLFAKDFFHKKSIQHNWKMKNVGKSWTIKIPENINHEIMWTLNL